jgi:predicted esterase YcpF (UPF0227 family)
MTPRRSALVGGLLVGAADRGDHAQAAAVGVLGKSLGGYLARHFGDVVGAHAKVIDIALDVQHLSACACFI